MPNKIEVEIKEKSKFYPIYMDCEPVENLKERILKDFSFKVSKYLVVISEKVYKLYGKL